MSIAHFPEGWKIIEADISKKSLVSFMWIIVGVGIFFLISSV